ITDFGLATGKYDPRYTLPGTIVGTPGYLAPEQASGKKSIHALIYSQRVFFYMRRLLVNHYSVNLI
ncbi:hypothetical protein K8I28_10235, partial [bacterium]|nr:hypothetical protein [bacterium]